MTCFRKIFLLGIGLFALLLAGCQTRSISNAGYDSDRNYRGELSELQVLGVDAQKAITASDIQAALAASASRSPSSTSPPGPGKCSPRTPMQTNG